MRTSQIALGVVLLLAAGCRDVLGIHAANRSPDDFKPATDLDAGSESSPEEGGMASEADGGNDVGAGVSGVGGAGTAALIRDGGGAGATAVGGGHAGETVAGSSAAGSGGTNDTQRCRDACNLGDVRCASSTELQVCGVVEGCRTWTTTSACGERQSCVESDSGASCVCQPAPAGCAAGVGSFCSSVLRLDTCAADADGCIYRVDTTNCPLGKPCLGAHPNASCSCAEPDECHGVTGGVCTSTSQAITCMRNSSGCLAISATENCPSGTSCMGLPGGADCKCPPAPASCAGKTSGNVCQSDTSFVQCATDQNGCVTATPGRCDSDKPCRGDAGSAACTCVDSPTQVQCPANLADGARCDNTSLLRCSVSTAGCARFEQTLCESSCLGTYPSAACATEQKLGWPTDLGGMQPHPTGALAGTKITLSASAVLRRFGVISRTAGTHAILVLFDDDNGKPHNRIAATNNNLLAIGVNEFAVALPPTQVVLSSGTYWLMVSVDASTQLAHGSTQVPLAYTTYVHGSPLPTELTANQVQLDRMPELNFYLVMLPQ